MTPQDHSTRPRGRVGTSQSQREYRLPHPPGLGAVFGGRNVTELALKDLELLSLLSNCFKITNVLFRFIYCFMKSFISSFDDSETLFRGLLNQSNDSVIH